MTPWRLEAEEHASIGRKGQTVFGDRRPEQIAAEALELPPVLGTDGGVGVKVEAAEVRLVATPSGRPVDGNDELAIDEAPTDRVYHPRDPDEWQGMLVRLDKQPICDETWTCGLAMA